MEFDLGRDSDGLAITGVTVGGIGIGFGCGWLGGGGCALGRSVNVRVGCTGRSGRCVGKWGEGY